MKALPALLLAIVLTASLHAQIPQFIPYHGVLTDTLGRAKSDSVYQFTFQIYSTPTGGNFIWSETQYLATRNGLFIATLGSQTPFPDSVKFNKPYWLSMQVGFEILSPRLPFGSVAYALNALRSDTAQYAISAGKSISDLHTVVRNNISATIGTTSIGLTSGFVLSNETPAYPGGAENSPALQLKHYSWNPDVGISQENSWYAVNWGFSTQGIAGGVLSFINKHQMVDGRFRTFVPFAIDEMGRTLISYRKDHGNEYYGFWGEDFGRWNTIIAGEKVVFGWPENGIISDIRVTGNTTMDGFLDAAKNSGFSTIGDGDSVAVDIVGLSIESGAIATFSETPSYNSPIYVSSISNNSIVFKSPGNAGKRFCYWVVTKGLSTW